MKIGVQLPEVEREVHWPELRDIALAAEEVGFDSIWVGDHLLFRDEAIGTRGPLEAWSVLAALAEATQRVHLGPLVAATSFHSPAMIAKKAATIDDISGGRLILGLGAGWNEAEYRAFGFPFDHRVARFEEAFTIIRILLREGSIDFEGRYYTMRDTELLPRPRPDIPLMIGSIGTRMLTITLPYVEMWNAWFDWFANKPTGLTPLIDGLEDVCAATGRDSATLEKTVAVYVQLGRGRGRTSLSEGRPEASPISGDTSMIAESLLAFADAGIHRLQLVVDPIDSAAVEELGNVLAVVRSEAGE